jgi:murein DD-endopeptidase MepM/ murein hydrolase activator NlpD
MTVVTTDEKAFLREERIYGNDTVASLLNRLGVDDRDALRFLVKDRHAQALVSSQLRPGVVVSAKVGASGELLYFAFPLVDKNTLIVVEPRDKSFVAREEALKLEPRTVIKSGVIQGAFFRAVDAVGIPDDVANQLVGIFGGEGNFYRSLRQGDRFSVVYEAFSFRGQEIRSGRILAAELVSRQRSMQAYWFQYEPGKGGYYTAEGKSLSKPFLLAPLETSKITSGFSSARFHPILQTWRAHKGVDYAAPMGTRVLAVADGVVETAESQNGYGNMIVIRHDAMYSTAYGHLSDYAAGMAKGARVRQGDTIGYVGQTGLATTPHLHYEFRINDEQVDPQLMEMATLMPLDRMQLVRFKGTRTAMRAQLDLAKEITLASIE